MASLYEDDTDVHVSSTATRSNLWLKPKSYKRALLRQNRDLYPVSAYLLAIIELQRIWRGVLLRRRVLRKFLQRDFVRLWKQREAEVIDAYSKAPRAPERDFAPLIHKVQARWRTVLLRSEFDRWRQFDKWPIYYVAATTIQRAWGDFCYAKRRRKLKNRSKRFYLTKQDAMAGRIQLLWRGFVSRQVFKFYVQLIAYRQGGDPMLMLKAINPSEAFLMDPAAGLHVRFRLAGPSFPPQVVYKIYTHRNVADVGAFAPRDYTIARKQKTPAQLHNKNHKEGDDGKTHFDDRSKRYLRSDNNPWRPVMERFQQKNGGGGGFFGTAGESDAHLDPQLHPFRRYICPDPLSPADTLLKDDSFLKSTDPTVAARRERMLRKRPPQLFFAESKKRKQAKEQRTKEKRRAWLVELYAAEQETLQSTGKNNNNKSDASNGGGTADDQAQHQQRQLLQQQRSLRETARDMFDRIDDDEIALETEKLLQWSRDLDFVKYRESWLGLATTAPTNLDTRTATTQIAFMHATAQ